MDLLKFLSDYLDGAIRQIRASYVIEGWLGGSLTLLKHLLIPAAVIGVLLLAIGWIRRSMRQRIRRKRLLHQNSFDLEKLANRYDGDLHAEIEHLAEELASQPSNPQPVRFPDGHYEIAREGMGGLAHRLFDQILEEARSVDADEVHVVRTPTETRIRYRISGLLTDRHDFARHLHNILIAVAKGRARMDIGVRNVPEHGFYIGRVPGRERRINIMLYQGGEGPDLVIRFTNTLWPAMRLVDLGLTDTQVQTYGDLLLSLRGLLLLVGPRHSGKTSLGYTTIFHLQEGRRRIVALEDRPLTTVPGVQQRVAGLMGVDVQEEAFREALSENPRVLYLDADIPERAMSIVDPDYLNRCLMIRVVETVKTGALLHRLSHAYADPAQLSQQLLSIVECRLIRKICPACRQQSPPNRAAARIFQEEISGMGNEFMRGAGCNECEQTGYKGLMGLFAVVTPNDEMKTLLREQGGRADFERAWKELGERSLRRNGVALARHGTTTLEELVRALSPTADEHRLD